MKKRNIKLDDINLDEGAFFVHNILYKLANGCSAVQSADSPGQCGVVSQELYDYVSQLIDNDELKIGHSWVTNAHNSVGFNNSNESYFFTYKGEITPLKSEAVHRFCMPECSYTVFEKPFKLDSRNNEKTYNLYIPWYDVHIDQEITNGIQRVNVEVETPAFAKAMPLNEYAKLIEMIGKHSFIPHLAIGITYFNKSGIEKIEKKMLELALKKYNNKPE